MNVVQREDDTARIAVEPDFARSSVARGPKSEGVLTVLRGPSPGFIYALDGVVSVIGRSPEAQVSIPEDTLSRRHACIRRTADGFYLEDLASTNGTFIDGERVFGPRRLDDGSRISLGGSAVLHFSLRDAAELEAARRTHELTVRDPLTRLYNRRHFEERLASEAAFAHRHKTALSVLMIDVDAFKHINDTYGHPVGDATLRVLSRALSSLVRKEDVLGRYGGEEFAIVARGIDETGAVMLAQRVHRCAKALRVPSEQGPITFSVSVGVAHSECDEGCDAEVLLRAADEALYSAKHKGRDRVEVAPSAPSTRTRRPRRASGTRTHH
jgi:two-component system, cell cycle response regulator